MKTVYLIGCGPGNPDVLTIEARHAIEKSRLLLGASRLLEPYAALGIPMKALVLARDIAQEIHKSDAETISVLLSGDPGFYSGAKNLYPLLNNCKVITLAGISSVNYFCSKLQKDWQDAALFSAHGRECNVVGEVQTHRKCIFLTGGRQKAQEYCRLLTEAGYGVLPACAGERLSYPEERLIRGTAEDLSREQFKDLTILMVENPNPIQWVPSAPALSDEEFQRGNVPMTKSSVRLAAIGALQLRETDTVWDIGAGTGSVSVACALAARKGTVIAVEQRHEAADLIRTNRDRFGVTNLHIIEGHAPEALEDLPNPDRMFIGGSSGSMRSIFEAGLRKNPSLRIALTAATLEGLTDGLQCVRDFALENVDVLQLTAAQARELGRFHLMSGENPVWILSGTGNGAPPK